MENTEQVVRNLVAQKGEISPDFGIDASFVEDLQLDSLIFLEVVVAVEKHFGIRIPETRFKEITSLRTALNVVGEYLPAK
jgi:acyl carrier protein